MHSANKVNYTNGFRFYFFSLWPFFSSFVHFSIHHGTIIDAFHATPSNNWCFACYAIHNRKLINFERNIRSQNKYLMLFTLTAHFLNPLISLKLITEYHILYNIMFVIKGLKLSLAFFAVCTFLVPAVKCHVHII